MTGMKKIDKDGLILCDLQGKTFEKAIDSVPVSSEVFVRRFMNSDASKTLDDMSILDTNHHVMDILFM